MHASPKISYGDDDGDGGDGGNGDAEPKISDTDPAAIDDSGESGRVSGVKQDSITRLLWRGVHFTSQKGQTDYEKLNPIMKHPLLCVCVCVCVCV